MNNALIEIQKFLKDDTAALITSPASRRYLCGFSSSDGIILITKNDAALFADSRYIEAARKSVLNMSVKLYDGSKTVRDYLNEHSVNRLLPEAENLTLAEFKALKRQYGIKPSTSGKISEILKSSRIVKQPFELESIIKAQKITDAAFTHILKYIKIGATERDIALELEFFMRKSGSEGVAFDTIAVSGKNTSLPHGVPTDKKIEYGDFVTMDFGAVVNGYCSDMTRTVAVGAVSEHMRLVYQTVLSAQTAAIAQIKAGEKCCIIDKTARDIISNAGYGACFGHALGHSLGIDIHEYPTFSPKCGELLKENTVITVEPGIYIENTFGVRIEDTVIVKQNGVNDIAKSTKELIVL